MPSRPREGNSELSIGEGPGEPDARRRQEFIASFVPQTREWSVQTVHRGAKEKLACRVKSEF